MSVHHIASYVCQLSNRSSNTPHDPVAHTCMSTLVELFTSRRSIFYRFVLGAVTPAVVVPQLLTLQRKGFGVEQGIPTLVMAASSFDDVIAISLFGIFLGIAFSEG